GSDEDPNRLQAGHWYRFKIGGVEYYASPLTTPGPGATALRFQLFRGGEEREFALAKIQETLKPAEAPKLAGPRVPGGTTQPSIGASKIAVVLPAVDLRYLDTAVNLYRIRGSVSHSIPGTLITEARVE